MKPRIRERFDAEIERWIAEGWLRPWSGAAGGVIPLLAVEQQSKDKVRPVLDYRELNQFVECHTGCDVTVCDETIRNWRRSPGPQKLVDLRSAYLQIHVDESLWPYQQVRYKGRLYCLTRLGFGLNCAPRIMTRILKEVLAKDPNIQRGTDHYIDDVIVDESIVSAEEVAAHLGKYGLATKPPEAVDGGRVLGLRLSRDHNGVLKFYRGKEIPEISEGSVLTRRQPFCNMAGRLTQRLLPTSRGSWRNCFGKEAR